MKRYGLPVIWLAPAQLGNPDFAAAALSNSLDASVRRLDDSQKENLARALDLPKQDKLNNRPVGEPWNAPAKRALLVAATAVMFHSRLDSHLAGMRPENDNRNGQPFAGDWPPAMAHVCANSANPVGEFYDAWNLILALDYKPIFETGCAALLSCPPNPAFGGKLLGAARDIDVASKNSAEYGSDTLREARESGSRFVMDALQIYRCKNRN